MHSIFEIYNQFDNKVDAAPMEDLDIYLAFVAQSVLSVLYKWGANEEDHDYVLNRMNQMIRYMENCDSHDAQQTRQ